MKVSDTLEESLGGGFRGLYGEVVECDCYRLKEMPFKPDLVFDIGANVGVFTRHVHSLYPEAKIVAVEPDPSNIAHFKKFTPASPNIILLERALGSGPVWRMRGAANGAHESYLSSAIGYSPEFLGSAGDAVPVEPISLGGIVRPHWRPGMKTLMKIDCEGGENCIWGDADSMNLLRVMNFLAIELHFYAAHGEAVPSVIHITEKALTSLEVTHVCHREHVYFWAIKKEKT